MCITYNWCSFNLSSWVKPKVHTCSRMHNRDLMSMNPAKWNIFCDVGDYIYAEFSYGALHLSKMWFPHFASISMTEERTKDTFTEDDLIECTKDILDWTDVKIIRVNF